LDQNRRLLPHQIENPLSNFQISGWAVLVVTQVNVGDGRSSLMRRSCCLRDLFRRCGQTGMIASRRDRSSECGCDYDRVHNSSPAFVEQALITCVRLLASRPTN